MLSHIGHTILGMNSVQLYMKIPGCRTPGIYPFKHTLATSFRNKIMSSLQEKKRINFLSVSQCIFSIFSCLCAYLEGENRKHIINYRRPKLVEEQSAAFFPSIVEGANPRLKLGDSAEHLNQRTLKPSALIPLAVLPTFFIFRKGSNMAIFCSVKHSSGTFYMTVPKRLYYYCFIQ